VNYYPQDIEGCVQQAHPDIRSGSVAAFSVSGQTGEDLVIFAELTKAGVINLRRSGYLEELVEAISVAVGENFEIQLRQLVFLGYMQLPKTSSGKIRRQQCKQEFLQGCTDALAKWPEDKSTNQSPGEISMLNIEKTFERITSMGPMHLKVFTSLIQILTKEYEVRMVDFDVEKSIFFYGIDSLKIIEIHSILEAELGCQIPTEAFFYANTFLGMIDDIARVISNEDSLKVRLTHSQPLNVEIENALEYLLRNRDHKADLSQKTQTKTCLLTGASGFVGTYFLKELLDTTDLNIACLIRAANEEAGLQRIKKTAQKFDVKLLQGWENRVQIIIGDMSKKRFGLEEDRYDELAKNIDSVYHVAAAGFMIGAFGLTIAFAINTLIFAFGSLFIYLVRTRRRQPLATEPEKQALTGEIILGLKYAWTQPAIRISLLLLAMINFAMLGPIIIGVAALVNVKFGGNATTFGYLQSAYGIGALLGVLVASQMGAIKSLKTPLVLLCYGLGAGLIALGFVQDFWIASGIIALMGIGGGTVTVLGMTWLQQNTASNMQGRMMGLTMFAAVALDPFSQGVSGVLVEFSLTGLFVAAGVTMFLTAIASSIGRTHTIKSVTTDSSLPVSEPVISVRNLNHYFGSGMLRKQVLFDINLDIQPGEIVIMTGPSGSGKTTLLTLMGGLRSAQEGSLKILGHEICGANKQQLTKLRRQIGYIFQAHNLMTFLTTQENVRMSLELHDEYLNHDINNKAIAMLESVGLGDRISYYPENLSGGQKQRVAIARALVSQPKIVLADEPTAALDKKSGRDVVELMQKLAKEQGCTILLVTHDNRILDIADRIIYMEDGQLKDVNITAKIQ